VRVYPKFIEFGADNKMTEKVGHPRDLSRWMVFNPRLVTVRPGRKRTVRFSVRPPPDLQEGEYRAVVFFEELPGKADSPFREKAQGSVGLQLKLLTRLGVSLYGMVGEPRKEIEVAEAPRVVSKERLLVSTIIENKGNFHVPLQVHAKLLDEDEAEIERADKAFVLQRGQKWRWSFDSEKPRPGKYKLVASATSKGQEVLEFTVPVEVGAQ
jgi:P pilus assembly chaperone PapD